MVSPDRTELLASLPYDPDPLGVEEEPRVPAYDWRPHLTRSRPRFHARHVVFAAVASFLLGTALAFFLLGVVIRGMVG